MHLLTFKIEHYDNNVVLYVVVGRYVDYDDWCKIDLRLSDRQIKKTYQPSWYFDSPEDPGLL